ncbi:MAG: serine hydrolase [Bacteroidota bacterium]
MTFRHFMLWAFGLCLFTVWLATWYQSEKKEKLRSREVPFTKIDSRWVDSLMLKLTVEEKIGQMIMAVADVDTSQGRDVSTVSSWLTSYYPGGIVFKNYSASQQAKRTHLYQSYSHLPLLIGTFSQIRADDLIHYPESEALSYIQDTAMLAYLSSSMGVQGEEIGSQVLFTTHTTEDTYTINKNIAFASDLQQKGILPCFQYRELGTAVWRDTLAWDSVMYPFHQASAYGLSGLLLDSTQINRLVYAEEGKIYKNQVRRRLNYKGLVFSQLDDSIISDAAVYYEIRDMLRAGTDMILVRDQIPQVVAVMKDLLKKEFITYRELDQKVKRILMAKAWSGAVNFHKKVKADKSPKVSPELATAVNELLLENTSILYQDSLGLIPINSFYRKRAHLLTIGEEMLPLERMLNTYINVSTEKVSYNAEKGLRPLNIGRYRKYDPLIVAYHGIEPDTIRDKEFLSSVNRLSERSPVIVLGIQAKNLAPLHSKRISLLQIPEKTELAQIQAAQMLMGGVGIKGQEIVNNKGIIQKRGLCKKASRLGYSVPEVVGMDSDVLVSIDSIVQEGIRRKAYPGAQVLVARKGKVIYHKGLGHHTYSRRREVQETDLYDLASITKVAATTLAIMEMQESGKLFLEAPLASYFRDMRVWENEAISGEGVLLQADTITVAQYQQELEANAELKAALREVEQDFSIPVSGDEIKPLSDSMIVVFRPLKVGKQTVSELSKVKIKDLLTHHSGLPASLPLIRYYNRTAGSKLYSRQPSDKYSIKVAGDLYLRNDYRDSIWMQTKALRRYRANEYEYSDVNMILLQTVVDSLTGQPFNQWLANTLYKPLGLQTMRFLPRESISGRRLIPTENDTRWRRQLLRGYVHDPTAALMGGVSGNAGLFSNANDLAIVMQMLLNQGIYGQKRFFSSETVDEFTERKVGRRAYGFDMKNQWGSNMAISASDNTYGHTGFTGTCVWVDPEEELIFIFLSNRIHPSSRNWKLNTFQIRENVHQVLYDAILEKKS